MKRLKRAVLILLKIIAVVSLVLGVANAGLKYYFGRRVEAQLLAIKAKGHPISMKELTASSMPDSENGAVVYERIFNIISQPPPFGRPGQPAPSNAMAYTRINRMTPGELAKHPDVLNTARQVLAQHEKGLALVDEAVGRPTCRFSNSGVGQVGDQIAFTRYGKIRGLVRLLSTRAVVEARDGRMDEAVKHLDMGLKVNRALSHETGIMSFLVRVSILRISTRDIQTVASYHPLQEQQAKRLFDTISTVELGRAYTRAFETERVQGVQRMQDYRQVMPGCLRYANQAAYLDFMASQIDGARLSYREARSRGLLDGSHGVPFYAQMTKILAPVFVRANAARHFASADLAEAQVFLSLQAYRSKVGSYPKTLDEVKRVIGWKLPADPFSDQELVYKPQADGFLLYSIGPDMKDDGGRVEVKRSDFPECPGDIVWDAR